MPYMTRLIEGYRRFRQKDWERERERWAELAEGQSPKVMILSCADSRVDPAQIFDARPGEMFVVRNIAALAPPYETTRGFHGVSAALEFAVSQLEVGEILVMGHGLCGGCAAALTGQFDDTEPGEGHFIADWVQMLHQARDVVRARHQELDRAAKYRTRNCARPGADARKYGARESAGACANCGAGGGAGYRMVVGRGGCATTQRETAHSSRRNYQTFHLVVLQSWPRPARRN